jgi:hypothetical protein
MFLVLLGAVLHATWNVIIKAGSDTPRKSRYC